MAAEKLISIIVTFDDEQRKIESIADINGFIKWAESIGQTMQDDRARDVIMKVFKSLWVAAGEVCREFEIPSEDLSLWALEAAGHINVEHSRIITRELD